MIKLFETLRPPQLSSWQTFACVMLALFILSISTKGVLREALAIASFSAGMIGATWAGLEKKWFFTPWLSIALLDLLGWRVLQLPIPLLWVLWPPLSAIFWFVTKSFDWGSTQWKLPAPAVRQQFILIFMSQILLSCWLQFGFVVQDWLKNYPSFLVDSFEQSVFVAPFKTDSPFNDQAQPEPRGLTLLTAIRPEIRKRFSQQDWSTLEAWLQEIWIPHQVPDYLQDLKQTAQFPDLPEDRFWDITVAATPRRSGDVGYEMVWLAQWLGPKSVQAEALDPYTSELRCQVLRRGQSSEALCAPPKVVTEIDSKTEEDVTDTPWWQQLRLWPQGRSRKIQ
ncbi:MAG: DUF5357 domain-containing protein [Spirulina sp. SIO3F2]|nr:DUF5357 domain-containing protein [Spirulina sp. SIO3F2]